MKEALVKLNENQMDLILFCLEQMECSFNDVEQTLCESIIDTFTTAQVKLNSHE